MSRNSSTKRRISYTALGLAIGLVFGGIVGLIIDNMIIFAGFGMVLGLAVGAALESRR
jgi:uncharacterized membrane protein